MNLKHNNQGFTIVEMLIVIVVIGILATISVVTFNGVRDRANVARKEADISNIVKSAEIYRTINQGFPDSSSPSYVNELRIGSGIGERIARSDEDISEGLFKPCSTSTGITKDKYCIYSYPGNGTLMYIWWWNDVEKKWIEEYRQYYNGVQYVDTRELHDTDLPELPGVN